MHSKFEQFPSPLQFLFSAFTRPHIQPGTSSFILLRTSYFLGLPLDTHGPVHEHSFLEHQELSNSQDLLACPLSIAKPNQYWDLRRAAVLATMTRGILHTAFQRKAGPLWWPWYNFHATEFQDRELEWKQHLNQFWLKYQFFKFGKNHKTLNTWIGPLPGHWKGSGQVRVPEAYKW